MENVKQDVEAVDEVNVVNDEVQEEEEERASLSPDDEWLRLPNLPLFPLMITFPLPPWLFSPLSLPLLSRKIVCTRCLKIVEQIH